MKEETILEKVMRLRPIDDIFFEKLMENKKVCEEILRVILENEKLKVVNVIPQRDIGNLIGRGVRLDAYCKLGRNKYCNIEVQKANDDNHFKRVRYNASCITANITPKSSKFKDVPDVTIVYISKSDIFKKGRNIYHVRNMITETNDPVNDGLLSVYVNTAVKDETTLSELMQCFKQQNVSNPKFPALRKEVSYYKTTEEGRQAMCKIVEDYAEEKASVSKAEVLVCAVENAAKSFKKSIDKACEALGFSISEYDAAKKLLSK